MQLWGVEAAALLDSMPSGDDLITAVEALAEEPYLLLGCASGDIQVGQSVTNPSTTCSALLPPLAVPLFMQVAPSCHAQNGCKIDGWLHEGCPSSSGHVSWW